MDSIADLQYRMLLPVYAQAYAQADEDAASEYAADHDDDNRSVLSGRGGWE
jgi:hypothetical protein